MQKKSTGGQRLTLANLGIQTGGTLKSPEIKKYNQAFLIRGSEGSQICKCRRLDQSEVCSKSGRSPTTFTAA